MVSLPLSPLLTTRLQPVLPLLVLRVVRLLNCPTSPASLVSQSPPSSSMSMTTYPLLAEVSKRAQSKTVRHDRFKDLYLRDFVHAGKMVWRDRFRNVELTHFQEEMMA